MEGKPKRNTSVLWVPDITRDTHFQVALMQQHKINQSHIWCPTPLTPHCAGDLAEVPRRSVAVRLPGLGGFAEARYPFQG